MVKFLLIVTYGRSGSTLLNGILNSIPGYLIMGENNDAYPLLLGFYNSMLMAKENSNFNIDQGRIDSLNPWRNDFLPDDLRMATQRYIQDIIDPTGKHNVLGWKEIRYPKHLNTDLEQYLTLLHRVFDCRFIFLTRNLSNVSKSKWWAKNPDKCIELLTNFEITITKHIEIHPEQNWFHLTYEDMIQNNLNYLFRFLNEPYDKKTVFEILKIKHSY